MDNPRIAIWINNISEMSTLDFIIGKGIMYKPSDNTFVSLLVGGGIFVTLSVLIAILGFSNFKIDKVPLFCLLSFISSISVDF